MKKKKQADKTFFRPQNNMKINQLHLNKQDNIEIKYKRYDNDTIIEI